MLKGGVENPSSSTASRTFSSVKDELIEYHYKILINPDSIFVAFCCACANGYDGSLMTAILAMPHFQNVFKTGTTGGQVSVVFSLYTV